MNLPQYSFNYHVHDNVTGDIKHHMEKRLGDNTSGYYTVLDADGFKRTVTYTADNENGFKAIVHRKPLLHNDAVPTAINTYHNIASGMQFDSLYSTPPANAIILAGTTTGTTAVPTYATDVAVLPVYQMPSLMTDVNTKYRYQTIDLPQQQPPTLQFSTENYQENEQQQVQQSPSPQNQQEQQQQQQQQQQHQDQQQHQHQHQHQHLQQLQPYPGDQQFLLPYPQQPLQQQSQQQHQQQLQQTDADDDSEIVEARFQTKQNNKQQ